MHLYNSLKNIKSRIMIEFKPATFTVCHRVRGFLFFFTIFVQKSYLYMFRISTSYDKCVPFLFMETFK